MGSNPTGGEGGHGCLSVVSVVCCQVEVSAKGRSLVQRSPTECGVAECDVEISIMRRLRPTGGRGAVQPRQNKSYTLYHALQAKAVQ